MEPAPIIPKRIITDLPFKVRNIEHLWIPLKDGTRLAARIWMPAQADAAPLPAILEYIPYRKRDGTRMRDEPMHGFISGHGYVVVRVDMRGSGESDGLLRDEYLLQEQDDALEVIDWISRQPWCDGKVGMMGKSWGGFRWRRAGRRRSRPSSRWASPTTATTTTSTTRAAACSTTTSGGARSCWPTRCVPRTRPCSARTGGRRG
jgi:alpha/beta superfamily hydrolase